jgi:transcriptional regulator with XRE-family HTH domain
MMHLLSCIPQDAFSPSPREVQLAAAQSPTVRRRRLGHELRALREQAGFTLDRASEELEDISAAKISRIETGKVGVRARDVEDLLNLYGVRDQQQRQNLKTLTRESRQHGWWEQFSDAMSPAQDLYIGLEAEADRIRTFEPQVVSGLFQTEAYARAILEVIWEHEPRNHIERRVALRMARQGILKKGDRFQIRSVLDETVLHRPVGGSEVLRAQLGRLTEVAQLPNVSIRILPQSVGAHPGSSGAFEIVELPPPDPPVVHVEYRSGAVYVENEEEVKLYSEIFQRLEDASMTSEQSLELITRLGEKD